MDQGRAQYMATNGGRRLFDIIKIQGHRLDQLVIDRLGCTKDLLAWEQRNGLLPQGAIVVLRRRLAAETIVDAV